MTEGHEVEQPGSPAVTLEQICSFVAMERSADSKEAIKQLLVLCRVLLPEEDLSESREWLDAVEGLFGIGLTQEDISKALAALEGECILFRTEAGGLALQTSVAEEKKQRIEAARDLEQRVKAEWIAEFTGSVGGLSGEVAWRVIRAYLEKVFRQHGLRAVAMLDPRVDIPSEDMRSVSDLVSEAAAQHVSGSAQGVARQAVTQFMATLGDHPKRVQYVAQLGDASFTFFTLLRDPRIADIFRENLSPLTIFLDTNFLFAVIGLDRTLPYTGLVQAVRKHSFPFKLRYHKATLRELDETVVRYAERLSRRRWVSSVSKAASAYAQIGGIEVTYHTANAGAPVSAADYFRPYRHVDVLLTDQGVEVFNADTPGWEDERQELCQRYVDYLACRGREKHHEVVEHDMRLLYAVRHMRTDNSSSLEAGALLVTWDHHLYRFDWRDSTSQGVLPCTVMPDMLMQVLRPYVPADADFERAFAETFALPEFRVVDSASAKACSRMLSLLNAYKDIPEETVVRLLSNDLLLDTLQEVRDDDEFKAEVESALVADNRELLEERAALTRGLEQEKAERKELAAKQAEEAKRQEEERKRLQKQLKGSEAKLAEARGQAEKRGALAEEAAQQAAELRKGSDTLEAKAREADARRTAAERAAFRMGIVAGLALGAVLALLFELAVHRLPIEWVVTHDRSLALPVGTCAALLLFGLGLCTPKWRKKCWGATGLSGIGLAILSLL